MCCMLYFIKKERKEGGKMAYNEKQKEYTMNYLYKLKEIRFRVKPEEFER